MASEWITPLQHFRTYYNCTSIKSMPSSGACVFDVCSLLTNVLNFHIKYNDCLSLRFLQERKVSSLLYSKKSDLVNKSLASPLRKLSPCASWFSLQRKFLSVKGSVFYELHSTPPNNVYSCDILESLRRKYNKDFFSIWQSSG